MSNAHCHRTWTVIPLLAVAFSALPHGLAAIRPQTAPPELVIPAAPDSATAQHHITGPVNDHRNGSDADDKVRTNGLLKPVTASTTLDIPAPRPRALDQATEFVPGTTSLPPDDLIRQSEKDIRFQELHDRLTQFLRAQSRAAQQQSEASSPSDTATSQAAEALAQDASNPAEPPEPDLSSLLSEDTESSGIDQGDASSIPSPLKLPPIISGPIDRIGLADNLFALHENVLALEMYSQIEMKTLDAADQAWVNYQSASCLRRLNRTSEALERYRRLAAQNDAPWLATISRWWLDRMDDRTAARDELARFQKLLNMLQEPTDAQPAK